MIIAVCFYGRVIILYHLITNNFSILFSFISYSAKTNVSTDLIPALRITDLFYNHMYNKYYTNLATLLVMDVIPISLLIYYNVRIFKAMKSSTNIVSQNSNQYSRYKQENGMVKVMTGIVVVFIVCHSLRGIIFIYILVNLDHVHTCNETDSSTFLGPLWFYIIFSLNCVLFAINSSVNMVIYCCINSKFRKHLISLIIPCYSKPRDTILTLRASTAST